MRSSDGAMSGARAGPDGIAIMPCAERRPARCRAATIAVACAVRHSDDRDDEQASAPPRSRRRAASAARRRRRPRRAARARAPAPSTTPKRRRPQVRADAQQRLAAAVILDERAHVEPRPAADEHADVAIVGPAFVDLDRAHRARSPQPVGELRQHALGRRPRLAPEAILGDAAGEQQQRAPRLGERRPRSAARLRAGGRQRDFGRRQHAADAAADPRERLDEMQIGDGRAVPELAARQRVDVRPQRVRDVLGDRRPRCRRGRCRAAAPPPSDGSPSAATPRPASVSTNDSTCQRIECGRNANGCTSVR